MTQDGQKQLDPIRQLSIQARADQQDNAAAVWWFRQYDDSLVAPWWSPERDRDLRLFWMLEGNDILQGAISSLNKKFKAMSWLIDGPQRVVNRYQALLSESEFGAGWSALIGKVLQDYLTQDKGGHFEIIGAGRPEGPVQNVLGLAHLDSQYCQLTGDVEYPVLFYNTKDGRSHKIHASRVGSMVDLPSPDESMNGVGFCGVSRVLASSQVLLKLAKYKNEKLDDLPPAGLLLLNNITQQKWDDVTAEFERGRRKLGHEVWANVMTMLGFDPANPITAEFLPFANVPETFDELQSTNIYINIIALAFGVDPREFWPITEGRLGSGAETTVQHQKAKGKLVGEVISQIERVINWKVLPASVTFEFDFQDDDEDRLRAEINGLIIESIMKMWQPPQAGAVDPAPVTVTEIRQMLADNVDYFVEEFLEFDITGNVELSDTEREAQASLGPRVCVDHKGNKRPRRRRMAHKINDIMARVEENYKSGAISLDDLVNFRLGQVIDNGRD